MGGALAYGRGDRLAKIMEDRLDFLASGGAAVNPRRHQQTGGRPSSRKARARCNSSMALVVALRSAPLAVTGTTNRLAATRALRIASLNCGGRSITTKS